MRIKTVLLAGRNLAFQCLKYLKPRIRRVFAHHGLPAVSVPRDFAISSSLCILLNSIEHARVRVASVFLQCILARKCESDEKGGGFCGDSLADKSACHIFHAQLVSGIVELSRLATAKSDTFGSR